MHIKQCSECNKHKPQRRGERALRIRQYTETQTNYAHKILVCASHGSKWEKNPRGKSRAAGDIFKMKEAQTRTTGTN